MPADLLVLAQADRLRRFDDQQQTVLVVGHRAEGRPLRQQDVVAGLVAQRAKLRGEHARTAVHEVEQVAADVAIAIGHRLPPAADRDRDVVI